MFQSLSPGEWGLLPSPLWTWVALPVSVPYMGQIQLFIPYYTWNYLTVSKQKTSIIEVILLLANKFALFLLKIMVPTNILSSPIVRETGVQFQVDSHQRLEKVYLMSPCLTLSIIRQRSRVKWCNPGNGVVPSTTPRCISYCKGSLRVILDNGRQLI